MHKKENGLYSKCVLHLYFSNTKQININVQVDTGIVFIQGHHYKDWSNEAFPIILSILNKNVGKQSETLACDLKTPAPEDKMDLEHLCEEIANLKSALTCLESSSYAINRDVLDTTLKIDHQQSNFHNQVKYMEVKFGNKIKVFIQSLTLEQEDSTSKCMKANHAETLKQKKRYSEFTRFQKFTTQIKMK